MGNYGTDTTGGKGVNLTSVQASFLEEKNNIKIRLLTGSSLHLHWAFLQCACGSCRPCHQPCVMPAASSLNLAAAVSSNSKRSKAEHSTVCREQTSHDVSIKLPLSLANRADRCYPVTSDRRMYSRLQFQVSSNIKFSACYSLKKHKEDVFRFYH